MMNFLLVSLLVSQTAQTKVLSLHVEYEVPVTLAADLDVNKFLISDYVIDIPNANEATLRMKFPEDMTGRTDQKFEFKLTSVLSNEVKVLSGANGKVMCKGPWASAECTFVLKHISIDRINLQEVLAQKHDTQESHRRFQLLEKLSNDPIGVTRVLSVQSQN